LGALSGHADREEMLTWMKPIAAGLKKVTWCMARVTSQSGFVAAIRSRYGLKVVVPERGESIDLL